MVILNTASEGIGVRVLDLIKRSFNWVIGKIRHLFAKAPSPEQAPLLPRNNRGLAPPETKQVIPQDIDQDSMHYGSMMTVNEARRVKPGFVPRFQDMAFEAISKKGLFAIDRQLSDSSLEKKICERLMPRFLQAVIDDDQQTVKTLLEDNPELLLLPPQKMLSIESRLTWRKFIIRTDETPLAIAAKNRQIEMIKLLLPYFDRLEQTEEVMEAKAQGLNAWSPYEMRKNAQNEDEIVIPDEYNGYINPLIDIFRTENIAPDQQDFTHLSEEAEEALGLFLDKLVPKAAVELDNHVDVELLLLAGYQLYDNRFNQFQSWEQRDAFCIRVVGLIQSALSPEMAKIFCEGLYYVVNENRPVDARAASLKLYGGEAFYRTGRESLLGVGENIFARGSRARAEAAGARWLGRMLCQKLCQTKTSNFLAYAVTAASNENSLVCNLLR